METKIAKIKRDEKGASLLLAGTEGDVEIVLNEDNPNNVKNAFNILIKDLKKGLFQYTLEDTSDDLYKQICVEYLKQLNKEMNVVYKELKGYKLLEH